MILDLVQNAALLVALAVGLKMLAQRWNERSTVYTWAAGLLFGAVGIAGMMTPLHFAPGVIYDGRSIVLSLAGFWGGPVTGIVAALMCGAYRIYLGGAGALAGVGVIAEATALGVVLHYLRRRDERWVGPVRLWAFGLLVHILMLALQLLIPNTGWEVLRHIGPTVLVFYPIGFLLIVQLFLEGERRRDTEQALVQSEERFRSLVEDAPDAIFIQTNRRFAYVNQACVRLLGGRSVSDVLGQEIVDRLHPDDHAQVLKSIRTLTEHHKPMELVSGTMLALDGTPIPVEVSAVPFQMAGEDGALIFARDVRARIKAEKDLEASEERFRRAVEEAPLPVMMHADDGQVLLLNRSWQEISGYDRSEIPTIHAWTERAYGEDAEAVRLAVARGFTESTPAVERTWTVSCKDRTQRIWQFRSTPLGQLPDGRRIAISMAADITDLKRSETALAESERRFRLLYENAPVGIFTTTLTGQVTATNAAMARILGLGSPEEAVAYYTSLASQLYIHRERRDEFLRQLKDSGSVRNFEYEARTADGRYIWLGMDARVAESAETGTSVIEGFTTDITERKRAEEALRESDERFRDILERIEYIPVQGYNNERQVIYWNAASARVYGYSREEALGRRMDELIIPDRMRDAVVQGFEQWMAGGPEIPSGEVVHRDKQGNDVPVYSSHLLHVTTRGERQLFCIDVDLHALRRAEEQLRRLGAAIDQVGEAVVITEPDGTIQYVNPAFEKVTGYSRGEAIGHKPSLLKSGQQDEAFYARLWQVITSGQTWQGRFVNQRKDGTFYTVESTISPVRDASGAIVNYVDVKSDITDQLMLEEQYRQSQKMEAVGQLAGGVAHDFNNILHAMMGYVQILTDAASDKGEPCEELREIQRAAERAATLTRQLLAFSRRQVMHPKALNLNDVIENFVQMLRRVIGEQIRLEWLPGNHLGSIKADAGMMEQVLMNLCVNARDAMQAGGTLTIETQNVLIDSAYCANHVWARPGRYVLLSVTDTGHGMDRATLDHVFEPFFTTKEEGKGTGLGLATVYGIIKQHYGMVNAYSEPGKGTAFKTYLPVCEQRAETVGSLVEGGAVGGSETVLLAEDDELVRKLAQKILERAGYTVLTANDGHEAVEQFKQHMEDVALLVLDVVMPNMDGPAALEHIRAIRPGVPVLFSSGYSENAVHTNFVLHEDLRLLQKPYAPAALLQAVRSVLDEKPSDAN